MRLFRFFLLLVLPGGVLLAQVSSSWGGSAPFAAGDANCDGHVDPVDSALILQLSAGLINAVPCEVNADVTQDGSIDPLDATLILQFAAGLIDSLGPPAQTPFVTPTPSPLPTPSPTPAAGVVRKVRIGKRDKYPERHLLRIWLCIAGSRLR